MTDATPGSGKGAPTSGEVGPGAREALIPDDDGPELESDNQPLTELLDRVESGRGEEGSDGPDAGQPDLAQASAEAEAEAGAGVPVSANGVGGTSATETEVLCPGCGLTLVGESTPRPTAAWFCPRCDYPLFWVTEPAPDAQPASRGARRRLPGTGGRLVLGAQPCWHCGEMSEPGDHECRRCAATLPKPLAPKVHVDVPVPVHVPWTVRPPIWPFVAAAVSGSAAIAAAITWWLAGGG